MENIEEELLSKLDIPFFYNNLEYIGKWIGYYSFRKDPRILFLMKLKKISCDYHWLHIELSKYFNHKGKSEIAIFILKKALENKVHDKDIILKEMENYRDITPISEIEAHRYLYPKNFKALGRVWNSYIQVFYYKRDLFMSENVYISIEEYRYNLKRRNESNKINTLEIELNEIIQDHDDCKKKRFKKGLTYSLSMPSHFKYFPRILLDRNKQIVTVSEYERDKKNVVDWLRRYLERPCHGRGKIKLVDLLLRVKCQMKSSSSYYKDYLMTLEIYLLKVLVFFRENGSNFLLGDLYVDKDLSVSLPPDNKCSSDVSGEEITTFFNIQGNILSRYSLRSVDDLLSNIRRLEKAFRTAKGIYLINKQRILVLEILTQLRNTEDERTIFCLV